MSSFLQNVFFFNRHGEKLAGTLSFPTKMASQGSVPAILLCQGLSGVKDLVLPAISKAFVEQGWIALTFDYSGFGESEGERGWIDPFRRVEDALYAFAFLSGVPEVCHSAMGIYGLSYGGPVAISLLSRLPAVKAAVAVSAPGNGTLLMQQMRTDEQWHDFIREVESARKTAAKTGAFPQTDILHLFPFDDRFMSKYKHLGQHPQSSAMDHQQESSGQKFFFGSADLIMAFHPEEEVKRKGKVPLLLISGASDTVAKPAQVREIERNAPEPCELIFLPGMDHVDLDAGKGLEIQIRHAVNWFSKYLPIKF